MKRLIINIVNSIFHIFKIRNNVIVFESGRSKIDGNPKAIYLYLKENYPNKYKLIYLTNKKVDTCELDEKDVVFYKTIKSLYYLSVAKYLIRSESIGNVIKKRPGQVYVQTFHGHGPIKKGGFEIEENRKGQEYKNGLLNHCKEWDVYISMCELEEKHIIDSTGFNKKIIRLGIPSTDYIVNNKGVKNNELFKKFNIPKDKKVILYAPTYRPDLLGKENINIRIESLKKLTDYVVLVRLHPLLNSKINKELFDNSNFINVCGEEDIVNLYLITDILISDYSASIYEFALTGKKIVLYPYDYDEYKKYPGFCIDYKKTLPGPICYDENKLYDTILNIENDRGNPKFEVLCQIIAYLHIPADQIFHPDAATDGLKKQKLLLMLQECNEQEAAEILPAIEYLLALIHKRGNSNE